MTRAFALAALLLAAAAAADAQAPRVPTFTRDVAPLLYAHCVACHRPGEAAPFSLLTYADAVSRARRIGEVVRDRTMPPWLPDAGPHPFAGARRLSDAEIQTIVRWAAGGAPRGENADLPPPPDFPDGWQLGTPDLVVELPAPYLLQPGGADVFRTFVVPVPIATTRYVRGVVMRPSPRASVHHASIAIDPTPASRELDAADPRPGFEGGMFSDTARSPGSRALGWTPGMTPALDPPGMAWRLDPGSDLVVLLHLLPPRAGRLVPVQMQVGLYFASGPPERTPLDFKLGSKTIDIPAGDAAYTIHDSLVLPDDVELLSVYPHAHYLAREMRVTATRPDGSTESLLHIPRWDFQWQDQYRYTQPVALPRGTIVTMTYTYDNSAGNRANPNRPPRRVRYGPKSTDEMGDLWLRLLPHTRDGAMALAKLYGEKELARDIAANEQRVKDTPGDARLHSALGASYLQAGRVGDGIAELRAALAIDPDLADAHNNLAHGLQASGRPADALAEFRAAARLAPENALVLHNLGSALLDAGDAQNAVPVLQHVVALTPASVSARNDLGIALGSLGRLDEAEAQFRAALALQPDYADARSNLAMVAQIRAHSKE